MQIKEVCGRTGLTERTVRFYIEKGLLAPMKTWKNGREYLDFSETDIRVLERIAALRRSFFTLEQIGTMQAHPERIEGILCDYRSALQAETEERETALAFARSIEGEHFADVDVLYRRLKQEASRRSLPELDIHPDFGRLDEESPEERETAAREWAAVQPARERRRKRKIWAVGLLSAAAVLAAAAVGWRWYHDNRQGYTILTSLMEVEVLSKGIDTSGKEGMYWLDVQIPEKDAENRGILPSFRLTLGSDIEAYLVWDGAVYDHSYPMARLQIFLTNRRLRELGLAERTEMEQVLQTVLQDPDHIEEFVRLESFQGEYH